MNHQEANIEFMRLFKTTFIFYDKIPTAVTGVVKIDIVKFENWLMHSHNYKKELPIKIFVEEKFGKDASDLIMALL